MSFCMRVSLDSQRGSRPYMEDIISIVTNRDLMKTHNFKSSEEPFTCFMIFDGHGGLEAARFAEEHLFSQIINQKDFHINNDALVVNAIRQGFINTQKMMIQALDSWPLTNLGYPCTSGTTVSFAFFRNDKLYIANVGDSTVVLGTKTNSPNESNAWEPSFVTNDHKPDDPLEKLRIEKAGGLVSKKAGIARVVWKREKLPDFFEKPTGTMEYLPFLSIGRSLGDLWSFNSESKMFIVSPVPDVFVTNITEPSLLVLASDGLWNIYSPYETLNMYAKLKEKEKSEITKKVICSVLNKSILRLIKSDNVSAIFVSFDYSDTSSLNSIIELETSLKLASRLADNKNYVTYTTNSDEILEKFNNPERMKLKPMFQKFCNKMMNIFFSRSKTENRHASTFSLESRFSPLFDKNDVENENKKPKEKEIKSSILDKTEKRKEASLKTFTLKKTFSKAIASSQTPFDSDYSNNSSSNISKINGEGKICFSNLDKGNFCQSFSDSSFSLNMEENNNCFMERSKKNGCFFSFLENQQIEWDSSILTSLSSYSSSPSFFSYFSSSFASPSLNLPSSVIFTSENIEQKNKEIKKRIKLKKIVTHSKLKNINVDENFKDLNEKLYKKISRQKLNKKKHSKALKRKLSSNSIHFYNQKRKKILTSQIKPSSLPPIHLTKTTRLKLQINRV